MNLSEQEIMDKLKKMEEEGIIIKDDSNHKLIDAETIHKWEEENK